MSRHQPKLKKPYLFGEPAKKIRTYDFVHDTVTDHRSGIRVHGVKAILDGDFASLTLPLRLGKAAKDIPYYDVTGYLFGGTVIIQE